MSEPDLSETKQLKRKSLDASPGLDESGNGGAPIKRPKVENISTSLSDVSQVKNGKTADNGVDTKIEGTFKDPFSDRDGRSPDTQRQSKVIDMPPSPEKRRTSSGNTRKDGSSPSGTPFGTIERRDSRPARGMSSPGPESGRERRESFSQEEKKRGRRLFGGLLSTLSQTTTNSQQKRRQEIEKRQQEKAAKQKVKDDSRRSQKLAKLERVRQVEQVRFNEQVMRTRHSNMLAMAHSLKSKSEPKLYYRPWDLTREQEDTIKDQIRDAKDEIAQEVKHFQRCKEQALEKLGASPAPLEADVTVCEQVEEASNKTRQNESTTDAAATYHDKNAPPLAPAPNSAHYEAKDHDEMVEAEEDTVIY